MQPTISAIAVAFPPHYYRQEELTDVLRQRYWQNGRSSAARLERLHQSVQVRGRHMALPLERMAQLSGFRDANDAWQAAATDLGEAALAEMFAQSGLAPEDVALLVTTTVTGIAVPTLDARLMNRIPFSPHLKRLPIFGLGCLGGAAGVARVADYLQGHRQEAAVLLAVELCSLTFQPEDLSVANVIACGLFGDGAAAVLMVGGEHPLAAAARPQLIASRSVFFPNTERVMGWDITEAGFQVVLSADVPEIAQSQIPPAVDAFLAGQGLGRSDVAHWIAHPGGPKVIDALTAGLELDDGALQISRDSLARVGNLSSVSVLLVLQETLQCAPRPGDYGLMMAMGPAFCAELVLLRW